MQSLMKALPIHLICLCTAFLGGFGEAQDTPTSLCPAALEQPPFLVLDPNGHLNSKTTLEMDFTAKPFVKDLIDVRLRLSRLGIELVALPVPWSPMLTFPTNRSGEAEFFNYDPVEARQHFTEVVSAFRQAGISTPNLLTTYLNHPNEDLYFANDHHWKLPAVKLAAQAVKTAVRPTTRNVLVLAGTPIPAPLFEGTHTFKGGFAITLERTCKTPWPSETTFNSVRQDTGQSDLLGDQVAPVVLFGSSFSRSLSTHEGLTTPVLGYGLQQLLSWELQADIQNESLSGAAQTSMLLFFSDPRNVVGRKLAVWEFPIYDFSTARLDHNIAFFHQLIALLSRAAHPDTPPLLTMKNGQVNGDTLTFTLPDHAIKGATYVQLLLPETTTLTPQVTFTTRDSSVTINLTRDGSKVIQTKEFLLRSPVPVSELTAVSWIFPTPPKGTSVRLEGASMSVFSLE